MKAKTQDLLQIARDRGAAVGAFNVYNLEGAKAVIAAAEALRSPVILQIHPAALDYGGSPLVALCQVAAEQASVPAVVHLDHCSSAMVIKRALAAGMRSIMVDGSHLEYEQNRAFTAEQTQCVHQSGGVVEAELGRISGSEDGLTISEREARMTDPLRAAEFVQQTGVDMLAVCIGNVHGHYARPPHFDFERLAAIRAAVDLPLVLHGTSGVPDDLVRRCIELGVCKFNVNTELRDAFVAALRSTEGDLLDLLKSGISAMQVVVEQKLRLFNAQGLADAVQPPPG